MARKKKRGSQVPSAPMMESGPRRINISLEEAENGYTINCSHSGGNGEYKSKSYVAPNERGAIRIATQGIESLGSKGNGKKGKSKKGKISISKKGY